MPYLQLELDAIEEMEHAAAISGVTFGEVCGGLAKLWRDCWRKKAIHVAVDRLAAFFPRETPKVIEALVTCEFLGRPGGRPDYLVRGAEKRLGIRNKQSEAGKKNRGNLKQYQAEPAGSLPAIAGDKPEVEPETTSGSTPALTSNIQHPASNSQVVVVPPRPPRGRQVVKVEKPTAPREKWRFEDFEQWVQWLRQKEGLPPEDQIPIFERDPTWQVMLEFTEGSVALVCDGLIRFSEDKFWEANGYPLRGFLSQWKKYVRKEAGRAAG